MLIGAGMGLVGIGLWLVPPLLHHFAGLGETAPWLAALGVQARLDGFEPGAVFGPDDFPWTHRLVIALRFLRLVLVVPLVEELFWRGFLMRFLTARKIAWDQIPLGQCDRRSVLLTALAFACVHAGPDFVPALIFGGLAGAVARSTGNLWAVVLMHAVANLCLGLFIMRTEWWGLW